MKKMRIKNFLLILCCVITTSLVLIMLGSAGQQNDSLKNIVTQTHQQLRELQENLRVTDDKKLDVDEKYLTLLGFNQPIFNGTKSNFSIVTYVLNGQVPSAILLAQNVAIRLPNELLLIYDLGISDNDLRILSLFCNNTKCTVITYDLSSFPSHITDERMHAYRPLVIKDSLTRSKTILFIENNIRIRGNSKDINNIRLFIENGSSDGINNNNNNGGVLGWTTRQAVSSRTHPKMFDYFETDIDSFLFLPMVSMDFVFFTDNSVVNDKILLPWIKCILTLECIHPIGAQSGGCKYNKKPQYRYSGCHGYDASAFNIVLGLTWTFDETKYSKHGETDLFYIETLEQSTKILENKRKNISDTSEHPFTEE